jgi:hypothetical protein
MSSSTSPRQTRQRGRADDRLDQTTDSTVSTLRRGTPPGPPLQTRLANIPAQVFQEACEQLVDNIHPEYDDSRIQRSLKLVWTIVYDALRHDPNLKEHLVDRDEFLKNVKNRLGGEQDFIKSLRDMAKNDSWEPLFDDGKLFSSFGSDHWHSHRILSLDVFITLTRDSGTSKTANIPELMRGARSYQILYISHRSSLQLPNARGAPPFKAMLNLSFLRPSPISSTKTDHLMQD